MSHECSNQGADQYNILIYFHETLLYCSATVLLFLAKSNSHSEEKIIAINQVELICRPNRNNRLP
jgi:hypothetical protein